MIETVLVTGADRGLGLALVRRFLAAGRRVFAGLYGDGAGLRPLVAEYPEKLVAVPLDVTEAESVRRAAESVAKAAPALDVLINNAGVHMEDKNTPLEAVDLEDSHLERTMAINAFGPLRVTKAFLPLLLRGRRRLIMNVSSEAGSIADCWRDREFAYCMSKAALNMQSRLLQNYLGPRGLKVLAVHPGWMRTEMGGPDADIEADEAAAGLFELAVREWSPDDGIYFDYQGKPLRW